MQFSKKAEYACVAMLELAARHGSPVPVRLKQICDAHDIPDRFLVQIMLQLKGAGLVVSTRGAAGGYQLASKPAEITVAAIIDTIDRADTPVMEASRTPLSPLTRAVRECWGEALQAERRVLASLTLADLVKRSQAVDDFSYQI